REIGDAVNEVLGLVRLSGFGPRDPASLSGGERQRVALARCLVKRPKLLLLDEPLAALDKRLREETRHELMALQQELGLTVIMVTHDQDEAMSLASRIAILQAGRLVQTGPPREIYRAPVSLEPAGLIGAINQMGGQVVANARTTTIQVTGLADPIVAPGSRFAVGAGVTLALRPEQITLSNSAPKPVRGKGRISGEICSIADLGHRQVCRVAMENGTIWQVALGPTGAEFKPKRTIGPGAAPGRVWLQWRTRDLLVFANDAR
ncbi:MAG: ABC transporter ATP-binding protein, partial [Alphaproteobacteria bacterium]